MEKLHKIMEVPIGKVQRHITIEETGKGNLLCLDKYGGRLFRSDEGAVRKAIKTFEEDYIRACCMFDEDPAHMYMATYNYNDLYSLLGILPTTFGDQFGYTNVDGYRTDDLQFKIELIDDYSSEFLGKINEPILVFEPEYGCYPNEFYREV